MITNCLKELMTNYHLCSHLPIKYYSAMGELEMSFGFEESNTLIYDTYFSITPETIDELFLTEASLQNIVLPNDVCFTLCPVQVGHAESGYFVLGPYTQNPSLGHILVFKPTTCIKHLISLLYTIAADLKVPDKSSTQETTLPCKLVCPATKAVEDVSYHVTRAKQYIALHYQQAISLEALANYLGINKSYLCTIFKKVTKQSVTSYINAFRIEKSKDLLLNSSLSILDIALSTGFNSASYFTNTFKKHVGQGPLEYRQLTDENK